MSRKRVLLTGVALLVGVTYGAEAVGRALFAPWSIGLGGRGRGPSTDCTLTWSTGVAPSHTAEEPELDP